MTQNDILDKPPLDSQIVQIPASQRRGIHSMEIAAGGVEGST
jgi:hypothetical protein